jgi:bacterioferritin-associated ferredoxin
LPTDDNSFLPTAMTLTSNEEQEVRAVNGGRIDLSGVTTISGGVGAACGQCGPRTLIIEATRGSVVDFSDATEAINRTQFIAGPDSRIELPSLLSISGGDISVFEDGVFAAPSLTTLEFESLYPFAGSTLDLSTATTYQTLTGFATIHANQSHINLSGLTTMDGGHGSGCGQCAPYSVNRVPKAGRVRRSHSS